MWFSFCQIFHSKCIQRLSAFQSMGKLIVLYKIVVGYAKMISMNNIYIIYVKEVNLTGCCRLAAYKFIKFLVSNYMVNEVRSAHCAYVWAVISENKKIDIFVDCSVSSRFSVRRSIGHNNAIMIRCKHLKHCCWK